MEPNLFLKLTDLRNVHRLGEIPNNIGSLVRIIIWVVFFFLSIGLLIPTEQAQESAKINQGLIDMVLEFGNPKGFRDIPSEKILSDFKIAWICGSSIRTKRFENNKRILLPDLVNKKLHETEGVEPTTLLYFFKAQRLFEIYICLLDAIEKKPDIIVITLNPAFVFNARAVTFRKHLFGVAGTKLPTRFNSWLIYMKLSEPLDWAKAVLLKYANIVREQVFINRIYVKIKRKIHPMKSNNGEVAEIVQKYNLQNNPYNYSQPLLFWNNRLRYHFNNLEKNMYVSGFVDYINEAKDSLNEQILNEILISMKKSGTPGLLYVAPLDPEFIDNPRYDLAVKKMENIMRIKAKEFGTPTLRIIAKNPTRHLAGLVFRDPIHLDSFGNLPDFLSTQIIDMNIIRTNKGNE